MEWRPNSKAQEDFLAHNAFEVLYGGQAGAGKSDALLIDPLRYMHLNGAKAIFLRRTFPELEKHSILRSLELFYGKATYHGVFHRWTFPSGGIIMFGHLQHEKDKLKYQTAEFTHLLFDELTTFDEGMYHFMFSRIRSSKGVPSYVRAVSNPPLPTMGGEWVRERWLAWVGSDRDRELRGLPKAKSGQTLWFKTVNDKDIITEPTDPDALSRSFIRGKTKDNRTLMENDPEYLKRLRSLSYIEREVLMSGRWDVEIKGNIFKREWFKFVDPQVAYEGVIVNRYWDLAASGSERGDWTAGVKIALLKEYVAIVDIVRVRLNWPDTRAVIVKTAHADGFYCAQIFEDAAFQRAVIDDLHRTEDFPVIAHRPVGNKMTRALVWSNYLEKGHLRLCEGDWVSGFIWECLGFTGKDGVGHDDQVDAVSGSFQYNALGYDLGITI